MVIVPVSKEDRPHVGRHLAHSRESIADRRAILIHSRIDQRNTTVRQCDRVCPDGDGAKGPAHDSGDGAIPKRCTVVKWKDAKPEHCVDSADSTQKNDQGDRAANQKILFKLHLSGLVATRGSVNALPPRTPRPAF